MPRKSDLAEDEDDEQTKQDQAYRCHDYLLHKCSHKRAESTR